MATRTKVASWMLDGTTLVLRNLLKDKAEIAKVDLEEAFPGFNARPEYERFVLVYGTKQAIADPLSGTSGQAKADQMAKDLNLETIKGFTFAKARGSGISYKAQYEEAKKEADQRKADAQQLLGGLLKTPLKQRQSAWDNFMTPESRALVRRLAAEAKVDLQVVDPE